eukprot:5972707-Pyramimonas_sp.AAC.1
MITAAASRGVAFVVEQPLNSMLYNVLTIKAGLSDVHATRVVACMGAMGGATMEPLELWGTMAAHR